MSVPPRVFISATSADLRSVRKLVTDAVLTMGCHPVSQDHFQPGHSTVKEMLEEKIKSCQALIHIVGHHYGAEPSPDKLPAGFQRRSFTQMEYDAARKLGIKTYVFVCPDGFPYDDTQASEPEELRQLQEAHRQAILTGERLYTPVEDRDAVRTSVQQLQLELGELRGKVERGKRSILMGIAALLLVLTVIGGGLYWVVNQSGRQSAALTEITGKLDSDRKLMLAVLAKAKEAQFADPGLAPADRLKAAIASVAAERSLSPGEVQASLDLFAASVESGKGASAYDTALVAMGSGDFEGAVTHARKAVAEQSGKANGNPAEAYSLLGDALLASQHFDEAAEAFRKAASLVDRSRSPELWAKLVSWTGSSLQQAGKPDEAEAYRRSMKAAQGGVASGGGNADVERPRLTEEQRQKAKVIDLHFELDEKLADGDVRVYRFVLDERAAESFGMLSEELDLKPYRAGGPGYQFHDRDGQPLGQPEGPGRDLFNMKFKPETYFLKIWGPGRIHIRLY